MLRDVLNVTRSVRDNELAMRRGEISIGHVYGDALLPFGS